MNLFSAFFSHIRSYQILSHPMKEILPVAAAWGLTTPMSAVRSGHDAHPSLKPGGLGSIHFGSSSFGLS